MNSFSLTLHIKHWCSIWKTTNYFSLTGLCHWSCNKKSFQNLEIKQAHYLLSFILHYWYKNCITFMNLKMPPDFWAMSFLATESSFPRTESRWEAAQKPIAMATPWGQKVNERGQKVMLITWINIKATSWLIHL